MILTKLLSIVAVLSVAVAHECQVCTENDCTNPVYDCFRPHFGKVLTNNVFVTFYGRSATDCLDKCRIDYNCKSVNYYCHAKKCDLNAESISTQPGMIQTDYDATHFERKACGAVQVGYECFTRTSEKRSTNYFSSVTVDNEEQCVHLCLSVENVCSAASYDSQTNTCLLSSTLDSETDSNSEFFEKTCNSQCYFVRTDNRYLAGYNDFTEDADSVDECIVKCALRNVAETTCKSAEYQSVLKKCYMSDETKSVNPLRFRESSSYTYVELYCGNGGQGTDCIKKYGGSYLAGNTYNYISDQTEESCKDTCSTDNNCRSALYSKTRNVCYLNSDGQGGDNTLKSNGYYTYFEKADNC